MNFITMMCIQVFQNELTCSMKSGINPIGTGGVIPKTPTSILLRHHPQPRFKKTIKPCPTAKLTLDTNFQLSGTYSLSI